MKYINTKKAPAAIGPYSQGIKAGNTLYISGQLPYEASTSSLVSEDIKEQTTKCLENIVAICNKAGFKKEQIVKCGVFVKDLSQFGLINEAYSAFFGEHKPARFVVEVARLPLDVNIEIDAIVVQEYGLLRRILY